MRSGEHTWIVSLTLAIVERSNSDLLENSVTNSDERATETTSAERPSSVSSCAKVLSDNINPHSVVSDSITTAVVVSDCCHLSVAFGVGVGKCADGRPSKAKDSKI